MKRLIGLILLATMFSGVGGCVYDPAYYHRSSVVYDDGSGVYAEPAYYGYAPGYYYDPYWYGWGYPYVGFGFSYYGGGHHHHHYSGGTHTYYHHH